MKGNPPIQGYLGRWNIKIWPDECKPFMEVNIFQLHGSFWEILMTRERERDVQFRHLKGYPNWSQLHDYHLSASTVKPRKASYRWSYCTPINGLKLSGFHQGYIPTCGSCTPIYYLVQSLVVPLARPLSLVGSGTLSCRVGNTFGKALEFPTV